MYTQLQQLARSHFFLLSFIALILSGSGCTSTTEEVTHPQHQQTPHPGPSPSTTENENRNTDGNTGQNDNSTRTHSPSNDPLPEGDVDQGNGIGHSRNLTSEPPEAPASEQQLRRVEVAAWARGTVEMTLAERERVAADIEARLGEVFRQNWDSEHPAPAIEPPMVLPSEILPVVAEASYDYQHEKTRYLTHAVLPSAIQQRAKELLADYGSLIHLERSMSETAQREHNAWALNTFHFLVQAGNFWGDVPPVEREAEIDLNAIRNAIFHYYTLWTSYSLWNGTPIGNRIAFTKRHYSNFMDGIQSELRQLEAMNPEDDEFAATRNRYFTLVDTFNKMFEVHPRELNLTSEAQTEADPYQKLQSVIDLTDQRFFKILAPFWKWLTFHQTGLQMARGLDQSLMQHPLTRLYFFRAVLAKRRTLPRVSLDRPLPEGGDANSVSWPVRNFNCAPSARPNFGGPALFHTTAEVVADVDEDEDEALGFCSTIGDGAEERISRVQLDQLCTTFDCVRFQETVASLNLALPESERNLLEPLAARAVFTPNVDRDIYQYLKNLVNVEVARYVLDEDQARQSVGSDLGSSVIHSQATVRLKTRLLTWIEALLKQRRWVATTVSERAEGGPATLDSASVKLPVSSLFSAENIVSPIASEATLRVLALHSGVVENNSFYNLNQPGLELAVQPGIYEIQNQFTMTLDSLVIHPLAILLHTPAPLSMPRRVVNGTASLVGSIFSGVVLPIAVDAITGGQSMPFSAFRSAPQPALPAVVPALAARSLFTVTIQALQQPATLNHFAWF